MKKKFIIPIITITLILTITIGFAVLRVNKLKAPNIDNILKSKYYENLSETAKEYIKEYYNETGEVLLTEDNKQENVPYLNPEYIKYISLDPEEQKKYEVIPKEQISDYIYTPSNSPSSENIPSKYDARTQNIVTPIKNQDQLGLCWAFATVAQVESLAYIKENQQLPYQIFSERQIDYATSKNGIVGYKNNNYGKRELGTGGFFSYVIDAAANGIGMYDITWKKYSSKDMEKMPLYKVQNYADSLYTINSTNEYGYLNFNNLNLNNQADLDKRNSYLNSIKLDIMNYGGAYLETYSPNGECAVTNTLDDNTYRTVIDAGDGCEKLSTGRHAMEIVGWDDDYEFAYCITSQGHVRYSQYCQSDKIVRKKGVWILKNSWGENNNYKYVYISYDSHLTGISVITDIEKSEYNTNWNTVYTSEKIKNMTRVNATDNYFQVNIPEGNTEILSKIKIQTSRQNTTYNVYVSPSGQESDYVFLGTLSSEIQGLKTIDVLNKNISISNKSKFKTVGSIISEVSVFTKNTNYKTTLTETYTLSDVENNQLSAYIYSDVYGISSKEKIEYKLFDESGKDMSNYLTYSDNYVAANNINTKIDISAEISNGKYILKTYYNNEYLNSSTIIIDVKNALEGKGTASEPYIIKTAEDLSRINEDLTASYVLGADIDLTYDTQNTKGMYYNNGNGWKAIGNNSATFSGTLDGMYNGVQHKIIGMKSKKSGSTYGNLFFAIGSKDGSNVTIKNIIFENGIFDNIGGILSNKIMSPNGKNNTITIDNISFINTKTTNSYHLLSSTISANNVTEINISNIYSNGIHQGNGKYNGGLAYQLSTAYEINSKININNVIINDINNNSSGFSSEIAQNARGDNLTISNVAIIGKNSANENVLINTIPIQSTINISNISYINDNLQIYKNKSGTSNIVVNTTNIEKKSVDDFKNTSTYSSWQDFSNYWNIYQNNEITYFPTPKNASINYTKVSDITFSKNATKDIYDYLIPSNEFTKRLTLTLNDENVIKLNNNILEKVAAGTTTLHIFNNYDGYERDVTVKVQNESEIVYSTINFNANGGEGTMSPQKIAINEISPIKANNFTKKGYTFKGWSEDKTSATIKYLDKDNISANNDLPINLYAIWVPITYSIIYNSNNQDNYNIYDTTVYDKYITIFDDGYKNGDKIFKCWNTKPDGTGDSYYPKQLVKNLQSTNNSIIILYAIWEDQKINIKNYELINDKYITKISPNTKINDYKTNLGISSVYNIKIFDINNKEITTNSFIPSGSKVKIYQGNNLMSEYINIIEGDYNNDGELDLSDVTKLYSQYMNDTLPSDELNIKIGDYNNDGELDLSDVAKLYTYYMTHD